MTSTTPPGSPPPGSRLHRKPLNLEQAEAIVASQQRVIHAALDSMLNRQSEGFLEIMSQYPTRALVELPSLTTSDTNDTPALSSEAVAGLHGVKPPTTRPADPRAARSAGGDVDFAAEVAKKQSELREKGPKPHRWNPNKTLQKVTVEALSDIFDIHAMDEVLQGVVVVMEGDFGPDRTVVNMRRWVRKAGGRLEDDIDNETTHLVATRACVEDGTNMGKLNYRFLG
jgi:hypothetical protein